MDFEKLCINCMKERDGKTSVCNHCGFDLNQHVVQPYELPPYTILYGKYLVGRVLGSGGFGITYMAYDMSLCRVHAIKEFYVQSYMHREDLRAVTEAGISESQEAMYRVNRRRFEEEAKILARLEKTAGVVKIYEIFYENNTAYNVMEFLSGETLLQYVRNQGGRLPVRTVLEKMYPVMDALEQIHGEGILHMDIAPDNFKISEEGALTLYDFGGAKVFSGDRSDPLSEVIYVKRGYSPMEQYISTGRKTGPWTDIYALAATIYFCICGEKPVAVQERQGDSDPLKKPSDLGVDISPEIEAVLLKGLAYMPEDRYQSVREFRRALKQSEKESMRPEINVKTVSIPLWKKAAVVSGVAGVLLAAVAAGGRYQQDAQLGFIKDGLESEAEAVRRKEESESEAVRRKAESESESEAARQKAESESESEEARRIAESESESEEARRKAESESESEEARRIAESEEARRIAESEEARRKEELELERQRIESEAQAERDALSVGNEELITIIAPEETAQLQTTRSIPDGSRYFNGHYYYIYDKNDYGLGNFWALEYFCERRGGHLAVIDSEEENDFIAAYVYETGDSAFFGYTDETSEGDWIWVGGYYSDYTNWEPGQPNNGANNADGRTEDYAQFMKNGETGTWNDAPFGSNTSRFVCEWE